MWADCLDPNLPRLALFACRDIPRGEQLFFDYNSPLGSNASAKQVATPTTTKGNGRRSVFVLLASGGVGLGGGEVASSVLWGGGEEHLSRKVV